MKAHHAPKAFFVYIFQNTATEHLKIGYSKNVRSRRRQIECVSGTRISIIDSVGPFTKRSAEALEAELHARYAPYRTIGEWFQNGIRDELIWFFQCSSTYFASRDPQMELFEA